MSSSSLPVNVISKWTFILFLLTGISGLLLMFFHPGHNSVPSVIFLISKHLHEISALLFMLIAVIHIYKNRKVLTRYFRKV